MTGSSARSGAEEAATMMFEYSWWTRREVTGTVRYANCLDFSKRKEEILFLFIIILIHDFAHRLPLISSTSGRRRKLPPHVIEER